jgi:hypothetical protein
MQEVRGNEIDENTSSDKGIVYAYQCTRWWIITLFFCIEVAAHISTPAGIVHRQV